MDWHLQTVEVSWLETEGRGTSSSVDILDPDQSVRAVLGVGEDSGSMSEGAVPTEGEGR